MEKKSFEELEEQIRKLKPLKFKNIIPENYKETIKLLIKGNSTYLDSDKTPQCRSNRSRGLRDIYRTVLYYHPDISFEDVVNETCKKSSSMFCDDTKQTVFYSYGYYSTNDKRHIQVRISQTPYYIENVYRKSN